ncbi:MAG TPA: hypothetical protein VMV92_39950 [Streptosporangiaceae bacterium]|nr:hypothetical protein [Streptosporangiaceae bacterium]
MSMPRGRGRMTAGPDDRSRTGCPRHPGTVSRSMARLPAGATQDAFSTCQQLLEDKDLNALTERRRRARSGCGIPAWAKASTSPWPSVQRPDRPTGARSGFSFLVPAHQGVPRQYRMAGPAGLPSRWRCAEAAARGGHGQ